MHARRDAVRELNLAEELHTRCTAKPVDLSPGSTSLHLQLEVIVELSFVLEFLQSDEEVATLAHERLEVGEGRRERPKIRGRDQ